MTVHSTDGISGGRTNPADSRPPADHFVKVRRRNRGLALLFVVLASCGGCTAAGCESILRIELSSVDVRPEASYLIDICVDNECVSEPVTVDDPHPGTGEIVRGVAGAVRVWVDGDYIELYLPDREYEQTVGVSVTVADAGGAVLVSFVSDQVQMTRMEPNGPRCEPVCFNAQVSG